MNLYWSMLCPECNKYSYHVDELPITCSGCNKNIGDHLEVFRVLVQFGTLDDIDDGAMLAVIPPDPNVLYDPNKHA